MQPSILRWEPKPSNHSSELRQPGKAWYEKARGQILFGELGMGHRAKWLMLEWKLKRSRTEGPGGGIRITAKAILYRVCPSLSVPKFPFSGVSICLSFIRELSGPQVFEASGFLAAVPLLKPVSTFRTPAKCVGGFPYTNTNSPTLWTPAACPTTQFNSDTNYWKLASGLTG